MYDSPEGKRSKQRFSSYERDSWLNEGREVFNYLGSKVGEVRVKRIFKGELNGVAWPVCVLDLSEVREEIDRLISKTFVNHEDPKVRGIIERFICPSNLRDVVRIEREEGKLMAKADEINALMRVTGGIFGGLSELRKRYNMDSTSALLHLTPLLSRPPPCTRLS